MILFITVWRSCDIFLSVGECGSLVRTSHSQHRVWSSKSGNGASLTIHPQNNSLFKGEEESNREKEVGPGDPDRGIDEQTVGILVINKWDESQHWVGHPGGLDHKAGLTYREFQWEIHPSGTLKMISDPIIHPGLSDSESEHVHMKQVQLHHRTWKRPPQSWQIH